MDIKAKFYAIHVPEEKKIKTHQWGVADVVINGIRISNIRAMKKPKADGDPDYFFSFPKIKIGDKYQEVIFFTPEQRAEIENEILAAMKTFALSNEPNITVEKMTVLNKDKLLAIGNVKVNEIGINNVRLYQNEFGKKYVQLPEYQDKNGEWHNLVQFSNAFFVQPALTRIMENEYEDRMKMEKMKTPSRNLKTR